MQEPEIKKCTDILLVGHYLTMNLINDRTPELFKGFMPIVPTILNRIGQDKYCVRVYPANYNFTDFNPNANFEKWAAVAVTKYSSVPDNMQTLHIQEDIYAVFIHKGPASEGERTYRFIFEQWLPSSNYIIDHRPHFDVMGEKYIPNDPNSEEEIWIPIKVK